MSETTNSPPTESPESLLAKAIEQPSPTPTLQEVTAKAGETPKEPEPTAPSGDATTVDPTTANDLAIVERLEGYIVDPLDEKPYTKVLLYGEMGGGKTKTASDSPAPCLVAIERGQSTLFNHPDILANGIKVMKFATVMQIEDFAYVLKKGYMPQYETIILDTFSELQYTALDGRVQQKWQANPAVRDPYTPEGKDYQGNTGHMRRIAAAFRDIDRNVIFVCHSKDDEVGAAKAIVRRPSTTPQVTQALNQYVDVVAYQYSEVDPQTGIEHFYAITRNTQTLEARITAKTRIKSLDTLIENLSFNKMHEAKLLQIEQAKKERAEREKINS
jgi:AAA domain